MVDALRRANVQVAAGAIGQAPRADGAGAFEISVQAQGRLASPEQFDEQVIAHRRRRRADPAARRGADRDRRRRLHGQRAARTTASPPPSASSSGRAATRWPPPPPCAARWRRPRATFPTGIGYDIVYDPTRFIAQSMEAVLHTFVEAVLLVVLVVILFLQNWRAAVIPLLAIPVSIIGTFAVLLALGFTLNTLTMFGLILAIGIVVDDAIVVVENAERHMAAGLSPLEAARQARWTRWASR